MIDMKEVDEFSRSTRVGFGDLTNYKPFGAEDVIRYVANIPGNPRVFICGGSLTYGMGNLYFLAHRKFYNRFMLMDKWWREHGPIGTRPIFVPRSHQRLRELTCGSQIHFSSEHPSDGNFERFYG